MTTRPLRLTHPEQLPAPAVDDLSATVLSDAIDALAALRTPYWLGDTAVHLHALASLLVQAQRQLPDAVAQARDQELTWDEIGQLLGLRLDRSTPLPARHPRTHGDLTHAHHNADRFPHRSRRLQHAPHRSRRQGQPQVTRTARP